MRLPFLRSKTAEAEPPRSSKRAAAKADPLRTGSDDDVVAAARTRARRRLVGAVVLLAVGVIGFPILFDTQPRPLPLDTPIETPRREVAVTPAPAPRTRPSPVTNLPADAGNEVAVVPPVVAPSTATPAPAPAPVATKPVAESSVAAVKPPPAAAPAPAPAVVVASAPAVAAAGRFVVQVGAYTDAATLREARAKVEKLGLKTYTQVIEGDAGKPRTRVRLGPYATREEANAAAAKIKPTGLPVAILTL
jgi:DedD protein